MKKIFLLVFTLVLFLPTISFAERWQTLRNSEYRVSMQAPISWQTINVSMKRPDGSIVLLGAVHNNTAVVLSYYPRYTQLNSYSDYTEVQREVAAARAVEDFKKSQPDAELVWKSFTDYNGHLSLQLVFKVYNDGEEYRRIIQMLIKGHYFYAVNVLFKPNPDSAIDLPLVARSIEFEQ